MGMGTQKNKSILKEALFVEWVFFCVYWGAFAIIWHFAIYLETDFPERSILYESNWLVPISSIYMYLMGAYIVLVNKGKDDIPLISLFSRLLNKLRKTHPQY